MRSFDSDPPRADVPPPRRATGERPPRVHPQALAGATTASTLEAFAANGDGTYDGRKVIRWLVEAVGGKPMSEAEAQEMVDRAMAKRK